MRRMLGSVAQDAVRHSPVPMLVLNEAGGMFLAAAPASPLRVLVPLDGSPLAEAALQPAVRLAAALAAPGGSALHIVQVLDLPQVAGIMESQAYTAESVGIEARQKAEGYLQKTAEQVREQLPADSQVAITWSVLDRAPVARTIVQYAEGTDRARSSYDLIAISTHGRSGLRRLVMGSVTERVLGATRLPLLIVHSH